MFKSFHNKLAGAGGERSKLKSIHTNSESWLCCLPSDLKYQSSLEKPDSFRTLAHHRHFQVSRAQVLTCTIPAQGDIGRGQTPRGSTPPEKYQPHRTMTLSSLLRKTSEKRFKAKDKQVKGGQVAHTHSWTLLSP